MSSIRAFGLNVHASALHLRNNIFLNTSIESPETPLLEKMGNCFLSPMSFLCGGKSYTIDNHKIIKIDPSYSYTNHHLIRIILAILALPIALIMGSIFKGAAYAIHKVTRANAHILSEYNQSNRKVTDNLQVYRHLGLLKPDEDIENLFTEEEAPCLNELQGPLARLDEQRSQIATMNEILTLLKKESIPCWIDCGTLLGMYRHGAFIPWDEDVDLAILHVDFENVLHVLKRLPSRYEVQDWSSYDKPGTYIRVHDKIAGETMDVYTYKADPDKKTLQYIWSAEFAWTPESWKAGDRCCLKPIKYEDIFPLKKASFALHKGNAAETYPVCAPYNTKTYLQLRYGVELGAPKKWDREQGSYITDNQHPYQKFLRGIPTPENEFNYPKEG